MRNFLQPPAGRRGAPQQHLQIDDAKFDLRLHLHTPSELGTDTYNSQCCRNATLSMRVMFLTGAAYYRSCLGSTRRPTQDKAGLGKQTWRGYAGVYS